MAEPWKESFRIRTYEADLHNRVKLSTLFNVMQEAASNHADHLHFGYRDMQQRGLVWVLSRAVLRVDHYPGFGEECWVETWPAGVQNLFAVREFRFGIGDTVNFGAATTAWLAVDAETLRPQRSDFLLDLARAYQADPAAKSLSVPEKLPAPASLKNLVNRNSVLYTDIDVNRHMNNVRYVEFVLNCFPPERFRDSAISRLQINFLSESRYGDTISVHEGTEDGNPGRRYVEGMNQNAVRVFQAVVDWR